MKSRLLSSIILFITFFLSIQCKLTFWALLGIAQGLACAEWRRLFDATYVKKIPFNGTRTSASWNGLFIGLLSILLLFSSYQEKSWVFQPIHMSLVATGSTLGWLLIGSFLCIRPAPMEASCFKNLASRELLGTFMLVPPLWSILYLWQQYKSHALFILPFLLSFAMDIGAFFAGKFFGKRPLAPAISPKKTWEGGLGGLLLSSLLLFLWSIFSPNYSMAFYVSTFLVIPPAAILGDLFESYLKRVNRVKDSGKLIPGHGGILDRIDSLCATLPCFVCILMHT